MNPLHTTVFIILNGGFVVHYMSQKIAETIVLIGLQFYIVVIIVA